MKELLQRMPALTRSAPLPIGVHAVGDRLELVQFARRADALEIAAAATLMADRPDREIKAAIRKLPFHGRRAVATLPSEQVRLMVLNYESDDSGRDAAVILDLLRERLDGDVEGCVVDTLPIRPPAGKPSDRSALAAVVREQDVAAHLDRLEAWGLEIEAIDITPSAERRIALWLDGSERSGNTLVVSVAAERTRLTVLWGRRLIFHSESDFGTERVVGAVAAALGGSEEEARSLLQRYGFARVPADENADVVRTLAEVARPVYRELAAACEKADVYTQFLTRGERIDLVRTTGVAFAWTGADKILEKMLGVSVAPLAPEGDALLQPPGRCVAAGLALRGSVGE